MQYGKWNILHELGKGGQGAAFLVTDNPAPELDGEIISSIQTAVAQLALPVNLPESRKKAGRQLLEAIAKYLRPGDESRANVLKLLHEPIRNDRKAKERLAREIEILGKRLHPNIVHIIDHSESESWFVTPYYSRGTLSSDRGRFKGEPLEALVVFRNLVEAVAVLHKNKIVHRDIKPDNIFVSEKDLVLGDLGIAHIQEDDRTRVSETYENVGSRDWMPAWAMGMRLEDIRPTFDVYALAKVLWSMIAGKTKMLLWYYNEQGNDLTKLFPHDENMLWINRLAVSSSKCNG